jgi:hypothetical protein
MVQANKRTRCGECRGWIEQGDEILFGDFRYHRRNLRLPIHPTCDPDWVLLQTLLETFTQAIFERSARDRVSTYTFQEARMLPDDESDGWVI